MSHSDENQDWDFSDSEEIRRNDSVEHKANPAKPSQSFAGAKRDAPLATPDPNQKKSALQELVEKDDEYQDRRGYGDRGDRRGGRRGGRGDRDRDFRGRDRDDRRGGYRDYGDRGGRPRGDKEFSNYSSRVSLP